MPKRKNKKAMSGNKGKALVGPDRSDNEWQHEQRWRHIIQAGAPGLGKKN